MESKQIEDLKVLVLASTIFGTIALCLACWAVPEDLQRICKAITWLFAAVFFHSIRPNQIFDRVIRFLALGALMALPFIKDFTSDMVVFAGYSFLTTFLVTWPIALGFQEEVGDSNPTPAEVTPQP